MRNQHWGYLLVIVIGIVLGLAIAGMPSARRDVPLHATASTTTTTVRP